MLPVNWLLTAVLCIVLVEVALRLPFLPPLRRLQRSSSRALGIVRARHVSDHWKEKAMAIHARRTFLSSAKIGLLLALVFGLAAGLVLALDWLSAGFGDFLIGPVGLAFSLIAATAYVLLRRRVVHG